LAVDDVAAAATFYRQLGFKEVFSIPDEDGRPIHSHLRKEDSVMFLGRRDVSHYAGDDRARTIERSRPAQRGLGVTLILQVTNLERIHQLVRDAGLRILAEPADEYYGDRVFLFLDPFGYEWKVSQPLSPGR
jgi:uncharacterized glyoxalase superfamily protein PhnB